MDYLATTFLNQIASEIFTDNALVQEWTFRYRFNPEYKDYPHKCEESSNWDRNPKISIADLIAKEIGGDYHKSISQQIREVIQKIYQAYRAEMELDGISEDQLRGKRGGGRQGDNAPWRVVDRWLWNDKYYRWSQDYIWNSWKEKAQANKEWIRFSDSTPYSGAKAMVMPASKPKETLPVNTPLNLAIEVDSAGSHILLFNRGQDIEGKTTKYLIAPSQAFAPDYRLAEKSITMPQQEAMCPDIQFNAEGKEEYIGIVVDDSLDLPWLYTDDENPYLEWQGKHLNELWQKLHSLEKWQVFYRDFDVVAA